MSATWTPTATISLLSSCPHRPTSHPCPRRPSGWPTSFRIDSSTMSYGTTGQRSGRGRPPPHRGQGWTSWWGQLPGGRWASTSTRAALERQSRPRKRGTARWGRGRHLLAAGGPPRAWTHPAPGQGQARKTPPAQGGLPLRAAPPVGGGRGHPMPRTLRSPPWRSRRPSTTRRWRASWRQWTTRSFRTCQKGRPTPWFSCPQNAERRWRLGTPTSGTLPDRARREAANRGGADPLPDHRAHLLPRPDRQRRPPAAAPPYGAPSEDGWVALTVQAGTTVGHRTVRRARVTATRNPSSPIGKRRQNIRLCSWLNCAR